MKKAVDWDTSEFLGEDEAIRAYLSAALEEGDPVIINTALGNVAKAKGMTSLAHATGLSRDGLYKALSPNGNPSFGMVQKVLDVFNLRLDVVEVNK